MAPIRDDEVRARERRDRLDVAEDDRHELEPPRKEGERSARSKLLDQLLVTGSPETGSPDVNGMKRGTS